jgi:hypothetical protein
MSVAQGAIFPESWHSALTLGIGVARCIAANL